MKLFILILVFFNVSFGLQEENLGTKILIIFFKKTHPLHANETWGRREKKKSEVRREITHEGKKEDNR